MPVGGLIAGGLGLAGSIGSSLIGANAAKDASNAQTSMGQQALALQQQLFGKAQGAIQPVIDLSMGGALNALSTLQKLLTPGANQTQTLSQIPGFQFTQDWGQKAVQNIGTTTGLGGNVLKAGADYATGAAQQGFGNIVGYLQNLFSTSLGGASSGANALAGAAGGAASTMGSTLTGIGNSQASGILGSANALSTGVQGGTNAISNSLLLSKLFGGGGAGGATSAGGIYGAAPTMGADGLSAIR